MMELQLQKDPDRTAFVILDRHMQPQKVSVRTFMEQAEILADWMKNTMQGPERIIIAAADDYRWILVFFAAMFSHHTVITLNRDLPREEMLELNRNAEGRYLFYDPGYPELAETFSMMPSISMDGVEDILRSAGDQKKETGRQSQKKTDETSFSPDEPAAIFFTSGTTGLSKAVMLSEKNILADINASSAIYRPKGGVVSVLPFYHSFGLVTGIFMPVNYSVPVTFCPSLRRMEKSLQAGKPQTMFMVPLMVETLHKKIFREIEKKNQLKKVEKAMKISRLLGYSGRSLKKKMFREIHDLFGGNLDVIICGGAFLDQKYIDDFRDWGISILNGYGITECSPVVAVNRTPDLKRGSVGQLVDGMEAMTSKDGELLIRGDIVMLGYANDDPETHKAIDEDGWLHTGDLGYADEDGFLFLTGRLKNLIILSNGENISPEQIENELELDPGVSEIQVYSEQGKIIAEICPEDEFLNSQSYFDQLIRTWNQGVPPQRQIASVRLRDKPFEKTATHKIRRKTGTDC